MSHRAKFANIVLVVVLLCCVILFIYTAHRNSFHLSRAVNTYYVAAAAGILLFSFALRWRTEVKVNFAMVILAVGVAVYLAEFLLFFFSTAPENRQGEYAQRVERAQQRGLPFDKRTRWQVIMELRGQGVDAYPPVFPALFVASNGLDAGRQRIYPVGSVAYKTVAFCNESGEYVVFESDEHGFNNPKGLYKQEKLDIVLIGDSFAQGECVKPGRDIAGQLRKNSRKVLTFAYGGNGPLIELAALKEYAEPHSPKIILWVYFEGNDLSDLVKEQKSPILLKYLENDFTQILLKRQDEIDRVLEQFVVSSMEEEGNSHQTVKVSLVRVVTLYDLRWILDMKDPFISSVLPLFRTILAKARDMTASWGGHLYFVYLPARTRYIGTVNHDELFYRKQVLAVVNNLDIPTIDFHHVLAAYPNPLSFFPLQLGHYTAEGYSLLAQTIETYLEDGIGR